MPVDGNSVQLAACADTLGCSHTGAAHTLASPPSRSLRSTDMGLGEEGLQPYHPGGDVHGPDMR